MSTERDGTGTGTKELEHVQCIRFNSHLNIALPDLAEASASHQSIIPLQQPPEQWHAWNLHIIARFQVPYFAKRLASHLPSTDHRSGWVMAVPPD